MSIEQLERMRSGHGFIAALDQSGGSTPKALRLYGLDESSYSGAEQMFDRIHEMRARIIASPSFDGDRILGAILFEGTLDREIEGVGSAHFLWEKKHVVPFLKIDKGLLDEYDGACVMKEIADLDQQLDKALSHGVFGTKMRSVIRLAEHAGVNAVVAQQFELAGHILDRGLVPIIEPEIDIHSPQKEPAEDLLKSSLLAHLDGLADGQQVMLKLTLPEEEGFYTELVEHPHVLRVVALSGGYTRAVAVDLLSRNHGLIASFSRALTEGLSAQQTAAEFDATLDASIASIYRASLT